MEHIIVCTQDVSLAQKIRLLLVRDASLVRIAEDLDAALRLAETHPTDLLILSHRLHGKDVLAELRQLSRLPPVIVLGAQPGPTPEDVYLVEDAFDTRAIYRRALQVLSKSPAQTALGDSDDGRTERPSLNPHAALAIDEAPSREELTERFQINEVRNDMTDSKELALEPIAFAKALYACWSKGMRGVLEVSQDHEALSIYFDAGSPIHVSSSLPGDRIGPALVQRKRITEGQYAEAAKRAIERGTRLATALSSLNHISERELGDEMGTSAQEQIVACFGAHGGRFQFEAGPSPSRSDPPFSLNVPTILSLGIHSHTDAATLDKVLGESSERYFKLKQNPQELAKIFPLTAQDLAFLEFEGKAYHIADAAEISGIDLPRARAVLALLTICEELSEFTPGVAEFEARIREERQRTRDLESKLPSPDQHLLTPAPPIPMAESRHLGPPMPPPVNLSQVSIGATGDVGPGHEIPDMEVPAAGVEGAVLRAVVYAKPSPRAVDGQLLDTPSRIHSRESFQAGVKMLRNSRFSEAEEHFRNATALCSEEHVYLIGLGRAIYYNPAYSASRKIPVLTSIVERAERLAPEDQRVITLRAWIEHAKQKHA